MNGSVILLAIHQRLILGTTAPLEPQTSEEIWHGPFTHSHTSTDAPSRAFCRAAAPLGTATAPPSTAWLSRGWWGQPNASSGARCLSSGTSRIPGVRGRRRSLRTAVTRATDRLHGYRLADGGSTGASVPRRRD